MPAEAGARCSALQLATSWQAQTVQSQPPSNNLTHSMYCLHRTQVLDLGQVVAGNFAGAMLAYFGATVYKVFIRLWISATAGVC